MSPILDLLTVAFKLLEPNESSQERKNLRLAWRNYKKLEKKFEEGGFTERETKLLHKLEESLVQRNIDLGES